MNSAPVHVVVPCYRQAHFLSEALDSLRVQTYPPELVIVVGSDDASLGAANKYREVWGIPPAIFGILKMPPWGRGAALNAGFKVTPAHTQHERTYHLALDADDSLAPDALECAVAAAEKVDGPVIVSSSIERFGDASGILPLHSYSPHNELFQNHLHTSSLFSRSIFDGLGGFDPVLPTFEDWAFWVAAGGLEPPPTVIYLDRPMLHYRVHGAQGHVADAPYAEAVKVAIQLLHWKRHPVRDTADEDQIYGRLLREFRSMSREAFAKFAERFARWPEHPTTKALTAILKGLS